MAAIPTATIADTINIVAVCQLSSSGAIILEKT